MRGQRGIASRSGHQHRIIPARAGPTERSAAIAFDVADHPRSCGANIGMLRRCRVNLGSSPLVRGQRESDKQVNGENRIIPARAGPTLRRVRVPPEAPDHPRSCGANATDTEFWLCLCGSSPLVRGQHLFRAASRNQRRIIPARAGPTLPAMSYVTMPSDHPRSCGASIAKTRTAAFVTGSSPLVRGQPVCSRELSRWSRIIPARAGPTSGDYFDTLFA